MWSKKPEPAQRREQAGAPESFKSVHDKRGELAAANLLHNPLAYAESIIDTISEPFLVLDMDLRVQTASRCFCNTFHVLRNETEGRLIYELGNGQWDIPRLRMLLENILPQQNTFEGFEVVHAFPSIGLRTMVLNARKIWREGNHVELILLAIQDITLRKKAEEVAASAYRELVDMAAELRRSNEDLEQFARVAGHDLKAPVRTMVLFSQLLARQYQNSQDAHLREYVDHIVQGGMQATALIDDLLRYATEAQTRTAAPESINAREVLTRALGNLQAAIEESGAQITNELPENAHVHLESSHLLQVFQNLIGNAIAYRRSGIAPCIRISAQDKDSTWLFAVQDNGVGIERQYAELVFELFRRLHGPEHPGSGIGLSTCKRVIERANGAIWVESVPGLGSTFYFRLPRAATAAASG